MIELFSSLLGTFENTYTGLIVGMGCMLVVIYVCTSFLTFIASLFKR